MKFTRRILTLLLALSAFIGSFGITASAAGTTMHGIGFVTASSLRLRAEANSSAAIVDTAPQNDCVVVISKSGEWYKVNYNLQEGYMHEDYLRVSAIENAELGYGKITGNSVNLRTGPSTSYSVAARSSNGDKCYILGLNNGWYKVIYKDKLAYIRSDFVSLTEFPYENKESSNAPRFYRLGKSTGVTPSASALNGTTQKQEPAEAPSSAVQITGAQILTEAKKHLGTRYASGGASPSGFDCSGLVYYVLKQLGYAPYRTPADQYQHGTYVEKSNLKEGDLVFFAGTGGAGGISHVGIYSGNGYFLHSPNSRSTVSYSDLTSGYWANHYHGARRIG